MELTTYKMHCTNKVFYLFDVLSLESIPYVEMTKWLCKKSKYGGANGVLFVLPSERADAKMKIFNPDGNERLMCGNGLRCVARYVCEKKNMTEAVIETENALLKVKRTEPILDDIVTYNVEIGPITYDLNSIPMNFRQKKVIKNEVIINFSDSILFTAVAMPSPHLVGIADKYYIEIPSHQLLIARYLNYESNVAPNGNNLSYVYPMANDQLFVRTFERGIGFSSSCATAMAACALVAFQNGFVTKQIIDVYNADGFIKCYIKNNNNDISLFISGNTTYIEKCTVFINKDEWKLEKNYQYEEENTYKERILPILSKIKASISV